jgi:hypothetical protein
LFFAPGKIETNIGVKKCQAFTDLIEDPELTARAKGQKAPSQNSGPGRKAPVSQNYRHLQDTKPV